MDLFLKPPQPSIVPQRTDQAVSIDGTGAAGRGRGAGKECDHFPEVRKMTTVNSQLNFTAVWDIL